MNGPIYRLENVVHDKKTQETDFVGPLDLILHLLSKNKIEIKDIPIAKILDQYMDWVKHRQELDLEVASEFIAMAAHLLYIKTRMLLSAQDEEALSEMEQLIASLEERQRNENYQCIKLMLPELGLLFERGSAYLPKRPEPLPETGVRYTYHHKGEDLVAAMAQILFRGKRRLPPSPTVFRGLVGREPYPVDKKAEELLHRLQSCQTISLRLLWQESQSRSEVVAVFIVVLELCRTGRLGLSFEEEQVFISLGTPPEEGAIEVLEREGQDGLE